MTTMSNKVLGIVLASMAITLAAIILVASQQARTAFGSVFVGSEYVATTTDSSLDNYKNCMPVVASTTQGATLGSVVVTLGSNASLYIYDATTTASHSNHATTTIVAFPTTATAGTYTFDVRVKRGICIDTGQSTVGVASTTITTRP